MHLYPAVLIIALAASLAQAKDTCPKTVGKTPLDQSKFAGHWFVLAGVMSKNVDVTRKCIKITMLWEKPEGAMESTINLSETFISKDKTIKVEAMVKEARSNSEFYAVWKKEDSTTWSGIYKTAIIATDYDNYAVTLSCKHEFDTEKKTFGRSLEAAIVGRNTTLGEETMNTLKNVLSSYDVNIADIKMIPQTDCTNY